MQRLKTSSEPRAHADATWTADAVAVRFQDAATTARRLPSAKVQGYFNAWPDIVRCQWEVLAADERVVCRFPPTPKDVEQMLEVMRWVQWIEVEQRHLVWMRAKHYGWREICTRFGMCRTTAWQRWQQAMQLVAEQLNESLKK
jgi:hypothetical protein